MTNLGNLRFFDCDGTCLDSLKHKSHFSFTS
jgi:hypothetical protein